MSGERPLVLVEWEDSSQPISRWQYSEDIEPSTVRIASVGWLVKRDSSVVALAPNVGGLDGKCAAQCSGVIAIPARSVFTVTPLSEQGATERQTPRGHTIQSCLLTILRRAPDGLHINDLTEAVWPLYGRKVTRVSVSPQLSRLKARGLVSYRDGLWFSASAMSGSAQDREDGLGPKDASATVEDGDAQ